MPLCRYCRGEAFSDDQYEKIVKQDPNACSGRCSRCGFGDPDDEGGEDDTPSVSFGPLDIDFGDD